MPLYRFEYVKRYFHKDDPQDDVIQGEGFALVEAATPEEANQKSDTISQTIDPRIEWDEEIADYQDLTGQGYQYEDFSFATTDGPLLVDPKDYDEETLERHRKAWEDADQEAKA